MLGGERNLSYLDEQEGVGFMQACVCREYLHIFASPDISGLEVRACGAELGIEMGR